jgi:ABC-type multidrug transport system fused ATPase/permease subunit
MAAAANAAERDEELEKDEIATKAWDSAVLSRLWRFARPHRAKFALSFTILAGLFFLELAAPWLLKHAIDGPIAAAQAARDATGEAAFDASPYVRTLFYLGGGYLLVILLAAVFRYLEENQLTRTGQAVVNDLRTHLFDHMQRLELAWFDRHPTGALVTRVTNDVENLNELFTSGLVVLLFDMIKVAIVMALLFAVSPTLATLVLLLTPVLVGVSLVFRGGARRAHRSVRARLARLNGYLQEVLSGIRVVQVFRREQRVSARFGTHLGDYLAANIRTIFLFALFFPIVAWVTVLIQASVLLRGGGAILRGDVTLGDFILFWFWLQVFVGPIRELGERYNVLQSAFASAERIFAVLDTPPRIATSATPRALPVPFRGHVRFENVSFAYDERLPVLSDVSFEIPPGAIVALVGATGAGKSTIVNLLLRFYDPTAGRVTLDGVDLRELDPAELRERLGLVLQEDFLFTGSVRDNLVLGRAGVTPESLARALEASTASDFVRRLPQGLETQLAERGATLSTGERELVAIARALAAGPAMVILDEATASVDSATEARIEAATHELLRGRSALVVAHRLSTVRRADRILVLHHGKLRESGTHAELLTQGGLYARLHALQFHEPDAELRAS